MQVVLQIATVAGSFLDLQVGLGMSQSLNPVSGVPVTLLAQFKSLLGMIVFLAMDGHHYVIQAIVKSYSVAPSLTKADLGILYSGIPGLLTNAMPA